MDNSSEMREYEEDWTPGHRLRVVLRVFAVFCIFSFFLPITFPAHSGEYKIPFFHGRQNSEKKPERSVLVGQRNPDADMKEYKVKAGFVYKFGQFTEWPKGTFKDAGVPFNICVLSDDHRVATVFSKLSGKTVRGRKIKTKTIFANMDTDGCHILFLSTNDKELVREKLKSTKNRSVLTVGETDGFIGMCGIINFITEKNKLRFQVNENAGRAAGLKFGSQLLNSARRIKTEGCGK